MWWLVLTGRCAPLLRAKGREMGEKQQKKVAKWSVEEGLGRIEVLADGKGEAFSCGTTVVTHCWRQAGTKRTRSHQEEFPTPEPHWKYWRMSLGCAITGCVDLLLCWALGKPGGWREDGGCRVHAGF